MRQIKQRVLSLTVALRVTMALPAGISVQAMGCYSNVDGSPDGNIDSDVGSGRM